MRKRIALLLCATILATSCPEVAYATEQISTEQQQDDIAADEAEISESTVQTSVEECTVEMTLAEMSTEAVSQEEPATETSVEQTSEESTEEFTAELATEEAQEELETESFTETVVEETTEEFTEETTTETLTEDETEETLTEETLTEEETEEFAMLTGDGEDFYIPNSNYTLTSDMTVTGDLYMNNNVTLNLSGYKLTVEGDFIQTSGLTDVNYGELYVKGDYQIGNKTTVSKGRLEMGSEDLVTVEGDFIMNTTKRSSLAGGTLCLKNGLYVYGTESYTDNSKGYLGSFYSNTSHTVVFAGHKRQVIYFEAIGQKSSSAHSRFNYVEFENQDIELRGGIYGLSLRGDVTFTIPNGTLYIEDEISLNGYTLTVNGDVIQKHGKISIKDGTLHVIGNYGLGDDSTVVSSTLHMINDNDQVDIDGDFIINSEYKSYFTNGVMRIGGDFYQYGTGSITGVGKGYASGFDANNLHKVIFDGKEQQLIHFDSVNSGFCKVAFENKDIRIDKGLRGFSLYEDMEINLTIPETGIKSADVFNLRGYNLTINGDFKLLSGSVYVNGGNLTVNGDLGFGTDEVVSGASLKMDNENDCIYVNGDFTMNSQYASTIVSGNMTLTGDFYQYGTYSITGLDKGYRGNFDATGSHTMIFAGSQRQSIYFQNYQYSGFENVSFKNPDIALKGGIRGFEMTYGENITLTVLEKGLSIYDSLDLNGSTVTVNNDLLLSKGCIVLNCGTLTVNGDFNIGTTDDVSTGKVSIGTDGGTLNVYGDFVVNSDVQSSMNGGEMRLTGDFYQYGTSGLVGYGTAYRENFVCGGNHSMIFAGEETQKVYFQSYAYSGFGKVIFENKDIEIVKGIKAFTFEENAEVNLTTPLKGLYISGTQYLNGSTINVKDDFILMGGNLDMDGGTINTTGDFCIGTSSSAADTWFIMEDPEDAINVGGDFIVNSNRQNTFNSGVITIKGNFYQYGNSSLVGYSTGNQYDFYAGAAHKVILAGKGERTVHFASKYGRFGILEIRQSKSKYKFNRDNCWDTLIESSPQLTITEIADYTYTGNAIVPNIQVYDDTLLLTKGVDYTVAVTNNIAAADKDSDKAPTVTVTGKGEYSGTFTKTFTILPYDLAADEKVELTVKDMMYTGKEVKPEVTLKNGKTVYTKNKHYKVTYSNNIEAGTATVTVEGIGNYTGTIEKNFRIIAKMAADLTVKNEGSTKIVTQYYTGAQIKPALEVYNGSKLLTEGTDYTLTYGENTKVGKGQIVLEGIGVYAGSRTISFTIAAVPVKSDLITVDEIADYYYDGTSHKPVVVVRYGDKVLELNKDYTVKYANNKSAALAGAKKAPTVTITGKGNYSGTRNVKFNILPMSLEVIHNEDIVITVSDVAYNKGKAVKPSVVIKDGTYKLVKDKDYTLSYENNKEAAAADSANAPTVIIKGKGNYAGSEVRVPFKIYAKVSGFTVKTEGSKSVATQYYTGSQIKPVVQVYNGKTLLTEGKDYTISYGENVKAGKGQVIVEGLGVYGGTKTVSFTIAALSLKSDVITVASIADCVYNAKSHKPELTVKHGNTVLVLNKDYTVKFANNKNAADADAKKAPTVTITGKGNYSGTKKVTFTIQKASLDSKVNTDLQISVADAAYNKGKAVKPSVKLKDGSYTLVSGKDYNVVYGNNKAVTEDGAYVEITGKGNYESETIKVNFRIYEKKISSAKVATISTQKYTGSQITPNVVVTYGTGKDKVTLEQGVDYIVSYGENVKTGKGYVYIEGIGTYGGTKTVSFKIKK